MFIHHPSTIEGLIQRGASIRIPFSALPLTALEQIVRMGGGRVTVTGCASAPAISLETLASYGQRDDKVVLDFSS